jgi:hypothetical protein
MNTLIISGVIAAVGWLVKLALETAFKLLIEYIKKLLTQLADTTSKVSLLDQKMADVVHAVSDMNKLKIDMNTFYTRLKILEDKFNHHFEDK